MSNRHGPPRFAGIALSRPDWQSVVLAVLACVCAVGVWRVASTLGMRFDFGTEGWNAYHAAEAAAGQNPYPPPDGLFYNNYPPIGFYLIGWLGKLIGDTIVAGRALSLLAFCTIAMGVAQAARLMGCARREAAFAALLFMSILLFDYTYVGLNDPHILGMGIQIGGLILVLREPRTGKTMALAALFFVAAVFTKHSLVAQPLVAGIWLLIHDRRNGIKLALCGVAMAAFGIAAFEFAFGTSLWSQLNNPRVWVLQYSLHAMGARSQAGLLPLAASLALLAWFRADKHVVLCIAYLVVSLLIAAYFLGGAGVGSKALYDSVVALSLCGGIGMNRLAARRLRGMEARPLYAACHYLPVMAMVIYHFATGTLPPHWQSRHSPSVVDTARDIAFLKSRQGPVLCSKLPLCFWAGKRAEVDLWGYEQAVFTGVRDGLELRDAIRQRRYAVLQLAAPPNILDAPPEVLGAYTESIAREIEANYRIDHASFNGTFWVPRKPRNR